MAALLTTEGPRAPLLQPAVCPDGSSQDEARRGWEVGEQNADEKCRLRRGGQVTALPTLGRVWLVRVLSSPPSPLLGTYCLERRWLGRRTMAGREFHVPSLHQRLWLQAPKERLRCTRKKSKSLRRNYRRLWEG